MRSDNSDRSAGRPRGGAAVSIVALAAVVLIVIPQNFVALHPFWKATAQAVTVVGGLLSIGLIAKRDRPTATVVLLAAAFFALTASLQSDQVWTTAYMLAPFAIGFAASYKWADGGLRGLFWAALLILFLSVAVDALSGEPRVAGLFGDVYRVTGLTETRPRGLLGQAVPTGIAAAIVAVVAARLSMEARPIVARRALATAAVVVGIATIVLTGTRSALLVLAFGLIISLLRPARRADRGNRLATFAVLALVAATALWMWPRLQESFSQMRAFSFDALVGTDSSENRQYALTIFNLWSGDCGFECKLIGSGPRDLQDQLLTYIGFNGLTTVDNLYITLLWDFGIVGTIVFISPCLIALRRLFDKRPGVVRAAQSVILIYISGFFFDTLYVVPFVVLLGLFFAPLARSERHHAQDGGGAMAAADVALGGRR